MAVKRGPNNGKPLLKKSEVSLILDNYEDIFSDFDPRPTAQRALSVDFLDEAKRATKESEPGAFELRFLVPAKKINSREEEVIRKRLKEHFKKHATILGDEHGQLLRQGYTFLFVGLVFMVVAAYILYYSLIHNFWMQLVIVLLEPGGWFLFWEGLDIIIFGAKRNQQDLDFYRKMADVSINFSRY